MKDPTQAALIKLRLRAIRRDKGSAQRQARPFRFKGPVRDVERDKPRGLNVRALLEACVEAALHPDSIGPIWRATIRRAFDRGALPI